MLNAQTATMQAKSAAIDYLKSLSQDAKVGDLYDEDENLRRALGILVPDFEYPDYSYKTICQVLVGTSLKF